MAGMLTTPRFDPKELESGSMLDDLAEGISQVGRAPVDALYGMIPNVPESVQNALNTFNQYSTLGMLSRTPQGKQVLESLGEYGQTQRGRTVGNIARAGELAGPVGYGVNTAKQTTQRFVQNMVNDLQRSQETQFYLPRQKAEALVKAKNPELTGRALDREVQTTMGISRIKATTQGLTKGLTNYLRQSFSPSGMAEWNKRGVSQTLVDLARDPDAKQNQLAGQIGWENLIGTQYGNLSPVLKKMDDEYYTHKSVMSPKEFQSFSKLPEEDSRAFYRTILANQGIKNPDEFIFVGRQPTQREKTGQLQYLALNKGKVPKTLLSVFPMEKPFNSADDFISSYVKSGQERMSPERRTIIKQAFAQNPELKTITDINQFKDALQTSVSNIAGSKSFGVNRFVSSAMYNKKQRGFKTNDELVEALRKNIGDKDITVRRNSEQLKANKDADVFLITSEQSDAFELGGVNITYKISKDGTLTAMVNDVNDLGVGRKNVNAPGAKKLVIATIPMKRSMITGEKMDMDLPEASSAVKAITEELQTPAKVGAKEYVDVGMKYTPAALGVRGATEEE